MEIAIIHSKAQSIPVFKLKANDYWYATVKNGEKLNAFFIKCIQFFPIFYWYATVKNGEKLNAFYEKCAGYVPKEQEFCVHKITGGNSGQIIVYLLSDTIKESCTEIENNIKQAENNKEINWDYIDF